MRRQAVRAYARWQECDDLRPEDQAPSAEWSRLKAELDLQAALLRALAGRYIEETGALAGPVEDIPTLRRRAEKAYARWRACDAQRPRDHAADEECTQLKAELDLAAKALFTARKLASTTEA